MLTRAKLTNFQRHRDLEVTFAPGLTALRGSNEAGKSTLIKAICYALFGVKSLPTSLEEAVTWGEPVNSLKVELDLVVDGVAYNIKRGKSGCELNYDGGRVTGQSEVTNFLCAKMKIDAGAATRLMLANQNEIRGALEAGTKATTELIERLAEFDQIDNLIELMQEKLSLGSTATVEAALANAEQRLEAAKGKAVKPDFDSLREDIARYGHDLEQAQANLASLEEEVQSTQEALDLARAAKADYDAKAAALESLQERFKQVTAQREQAYSAANTYSAEAASEAELEALVGTLTNASNYLAAYRRVSDHLGAPKAVSEEVTPAALAEMIRNQREAIAMLAETIAKCQKDAAVAQAGLSSGSCSFCGEDFSHLPAVAQKNAELQARIEAAQRTEAESREEKKRIEIRLTTLVSIQEESRPRLATLSANPDYVEATDNRLPPTLRWVGPNVAALEASEAKLAQAKRDLKSLRDDDARRQEASARYTLLRNQASGLESEIDESRKVLTTAHLPDLASAEKAREEVLSRRRPLTVKVSDMQAAKRDAEYTLRDAEREYTRAVEAMAQAEEDLTRRRDDLKNLAFNNALLKRVRQARPLIADQLWTIVLSAVSGYFSEMRGVKSRVSKDSDGFKVDEHPISTLSGSTLDILGLAIRVALVRTFLPTAPFLVLDEPAAAMDSSRTELMLGFLTACGFRQTILVTHEDISEAVADHMIQL